QVHIREAASPRRRAYWREARPGGSRCFIRWCLAGVVEGDVEGWCACELAAVDKHGGAGDEGGSTRAGPEDGGRDLFRPAGALQWHRGGGLLCWIADVGDVVGEDRDGSGRVDADAVGGVVERGDLS